MIKSLIGKLFHGDCLKYLFVMLGFVVPAIASASQLADIAFLAFSDDGYWQVWRMGAGGSGQRQVTNSAYDKSRVSWYPDGQFLMVNGNQGELAKVDAESGEETPIKTDLAGMNDAVLSPDGGFIAFSLSTSDSIDDNNIWLVKADGSDPRKLTNKQFLQHDPAWSRDSRVIYFSSGRGDQVHDLWRFDVGKRSLEQLTAGQLYNFDIAPGPEGTLAFSSNRSGNYEIWLWESGREPRPLTTDPALDARPSWAPDGTSLVFESTRDGGPNIWRLSLGGGEVMRLTNKEKGARSPVWFRGSE